MQPTAEQYAAIHTHDRNLVVVAGAGSGKTRVLVERYLALLEANPTWELNALVAVTFTQKAAQEMRDRVRQALQARLFAATSVTDQSRWARLLATMDTARIDTIHALCGALLRANAAEAGLDPRFQILDEINSRLLAEDVVERTLAALLNDSGTVDPTVRLFTVYDAKQIRKTLVEFVNTPLPELPADSDAVLAGWQAHWEQQTKRFVLLALRSSEFESTAQWLAETPFPVGDKLADQARDVQAAMDRLLLLQPNDPLDRFVNSVQHFPNPNLKVGSATAWGNSEVLKEAKRRLKTAREWAITLKGLIGEALNDLDHQAAAWLPLWARLIEQAQGAYRQAKIHNDLLDFDDLEIYTANLLARYPHVRARYLGAEFRHVLVDEFQDTNALQWAIIQALTAPDQPTERGQVARLFVVGDPKQSIYAFRGADVSVFEQTRALLQHEIPLVQSFRAHERLVSLFNHVFGQLLAKSPDSPVIHYEVEYGLPMSAP
ncbi:MAG: UvrD-helicase domain-containing protein, partial [Phototrophicaceae bacterium]